MGRRRKGKLLLVLFASILLLVGCSEKTVKDLEKNAKLEEKVEEEEVSKEQQEKETAEKEEEQIEEEEPPIAVEVVHPESKEVVETFLPLELGYDAKNDMYKEKMEKWAKELARGTEDSEGYDKRMVLDKIGKKGQIIKGSPRVILEEAELVEKIIEASDTGGIVELPLYITESGYELEDVPHLDEEVVASYTTYYNSSVVGRTKNIELSAKAINNVIVGRGDIFSFNTTVGPSDEAHGYQPAEEAVNGKLVMGIGGGICQTSSTLFNAIDQLGVTYVEKHNHSVNVGYVPKGRDATVSYGGLDFRFENSTGVPLLIKTKMKNGALTVEIRTSKKYKKQLKI